MFSRLFPCRPIRAVALLGALPKSSFSFTPNVPHSLSARELLWAGPLSSHVKRCVARGDDSNDHAEYTLLRLVKVATPFRWSSDTLAASMVRMSGADFPVDITVAWILLRLIDASLHIEAAGISPVHRAPLPLPSSGAKHPTPPALLGALVSAVVFLGIAIGAQFVSVCTADTPTLFDADESLVLNTTSAALKEHLGFGDTTDIISPDSAPSSPSDVSTDTLTWEDTQLGG